MCKIGDVRNEHEKCSFWIVCTMHVSDMLFVRRIFAFPIRLQRAAIWSVLSVPLSVFGFCCCDDCGLDLTCGIIIHVRSNTN